MSRSRKQGADRPDPAAEAFAAGADLVRRNPALAAVHADFVRAKGNADAPGQGLVRADSNGRVHIHPTRRAEPGEWAWALAHALLHLGFGHLPAAKEPREQPDRFDLAARCTVVNRFLATFPIGTAPDHLPESYPDGDEEQLAARWRKTDVPAAYERCGTADGEPDQLLVQWPRWDTALPDRQLAFAYALTRTVSAAMDVAGGRRDRLTGERVAQRPWDRALNWFVSSYPLLGGLAAGLTVVADAELARVHDIAVAAVDASMRRDLHQPAQAVHGRGVAVHPRPRDAARRPAPRWASGRPRPLPLQRRRRLRDQRLAGGDERRRDARRTAVRRRVEGPVDRGGVRPDRHRPAARPPPRNAPRQGHGRHPGRTPPGRTADPVDLDAFYRRALVQGHQLHTDRQRGLLPAGLVQEIRALAHPPVPWDARLARWFDEFVPRPEPVRSYSRPARRQASTPDIPRAGRSFPPEEVARCTFGVVLDTSGSMSGPLLAKALGAIASYAEARDVPAARVVFCDAAAYDAGYLAPTEIAGRVRVKGAAARSCNPASTSFTVPTTSRRRPPSW